LATCFSTASTSVSAGTFPKWDITYTVRFDGRRLLEVAPKETL
jgi:hypothetical protein